MLAQVREQPLFGVGFGRSSTFFLNVRSSNGFLVPFRQDIGQDPHNGFLFLWAGGGIVALGSYLWLLAVFTFDAVRRYRRSETDTERLLIAWAGATLFVFLFEAALGDDVRVPERSAADLGLDRPAGGRADTRTGDRRLAETCSLTSSRCASSPSR